MAVILVLDEVPVDRIDIGYVFECLGLYMTDRFPTHHQVVAEYATTVPVFSCKQIMYPGHAQIHTLASEYQLPFVLRSLVHGLRYEQPEMPYEGLSH